MMTYYYQYILTDGTVGLFKVRAESAAYALCFAGYDLRLRFKEDLASFKHCPDTTH